MLSARVLSIEEFFQLGLFKVASVQRDYVWDSVKSEQLFNDIDRASAKIAEDNDDISESRVSVADGSDEEDWPERQTEDPSEDLPSRQLPGSYYLGGIMLRHAEDRSFEIFDGLQRATTLTILLCILRDITRSEALRARIRSLIKVGNECRIALPGTDSTLYSEIQTDGQAIRGFRRPVSPRGERIRTARSRFHSYIKAWDEERVCRFGSFLLEKTLFVVAETADAALARQAFIAANDRGIFLKPIDIFKGQLLDLAGSAEEEAARRWGEISQVAGDGLEEFMQAYDFIQRREPQGADHLAKLAEHIDKKHGAGGVMAVLEDIKDHANAWAELGLKINQAGNSIADPDIWKLRFFKWFEWKPLALAWYKEHRDRRVTARSGAAAKGDKLFRKRFSTLNRACMVMTLARFSATDRATIMRKALAQWRANKDPFSIAGQKPGALTFPQVQLARVLESLKTPIYDEEMRLSLLRWIEAGLAQKPHPDLANATVEHVLPQRPHQNSQWIRDFPNEEERFSACHSIGNLAIMDYEKNWKIKNEDFSTKRPVIKEQAAKYKMLAEIAEKKNWTAEAIRERAAVMIERVWEQLNIPAPARKPPAANAVR